jgi:hypothetical protein
MKELKRFFSQPGGMTARGNVGIPDENVLKSGFAEF